MLRSLLFGDLPAFKADPLAFLEDRVLGASAPVPLRFANRRILVLAHPEAVRHVLVDRAAAYPKSRFQDRLKPLFGEGMVTAGGQRWKDSRKAVRGQFGGAMLDEGMQFAINTLVAEVAELAKRDEGGMEGKTVSLPPLTGRLTLRMASAAMFRQVFDQATADEIYDLASAAHAWVSDVIWRPIDFGTRLPTSGNRRFRALLETMERVVTELRQDPRGVLASLASLEETYGPTAVRDEFVTMILAGFETSGTTAAWLLYAMADNPDLMAWMREDVDATIADGRDLTPADLYTMPRVQAFVDEVMRLYPAIWWYAREAAEDDVIMGIPVTKGTTVFVCPWILHRQPDLWSAPLTFSPARFLDAEGRYKAPARHTYIPFGAGARTCIGQHLARAEMIALAAVMASGFDLAPLSGPMAALRPVGGVTLAPPAHGMTVRLGVRERATSQGHQHQGRPTQA